MKKFTKVFAVVLALAAIISCFAACGGKKDETPALTATEGKLIMATNASFPPYEFVDEGGQFAGIDVEIAGLIAEKLGLTLEIQDVEFGSIIGGVQSGKFDIGMAGMTVTKDRLKSVNFSNTYATGIQSIIVPENSTVASFDDFFEADGTTVKADVKIGVQQDTTGDIYCSSSVEDGGVGADHVIQYKTGNEAVQALVAGKVSAVIIDNEPAKSYVAANEGLKILDTAFTEEEYAISINKENTALLDAINAALTELTEAGKVDEVINKYIAK